MGQTKPFGLKSIISESNECEWEKLLIVGMKNIDIKIVIKIIKIIK